MESSPFTTNRLRPSDHRPAASRRHRLPRNIACVCLAIAGTAPAARAGGFPPEEPGGPRTTLFSWDEVSPPPPDPVGTAGDSVLLTLTRQAENTREDFWDRDKKWAGVFRISDLPETPAHIELVSAVRRAQPDGGDPEMEWATAPESMFALAGLSLGGVFLLRYTGMRRRPGLYFHGLWKRRRAVVVRHRPPFAPVCQKKTRLTGG